MRREVRQRYKGSLLGVAWTLVTPAIMVGAYSLVFKFMLQVPIENYALYLFVGLTIWQFFFFGVQLAAQSVVANANLIKKVRFPRAIIPLATITGNGVTAAAMFVVALPLCVWLSQDSPLPMVVLPVLVLLLVAFTAGLGLLAAGLNVYFRDVEHIIAAIGLPWIFLTPIFYDLTPERVPGFADHPWAADLLHYGNPIAPFVIAIRDPLLNGIWPSPGDVLYCVAAATIALAVGLWGFQRLQREMAIEL